MYDFDRVIPLLRRFDLTALTKNAYYLFSGTPYGFFRPSVVDIGLITAGSTVDLTTDGVDKVPTVIVPGSVIYTKTGNQNAPQVAGDVLAPTIWEERTVLSLPDDYTIRVTEAIDIIARTASFAYRVLFTGDASDEGWFATGKVRERILTVQVHSGGPVDVEVWGKTGDTAFMIEAFTVADGVVKTYGGVSDFTRVLFSSAVAANVSASIVNRRF